MKPQFSKGKSLVAATGERVSGLFVFLIEIIKLIINEVAALIALFIVSWPNTYLGYKMREVYWRKKAGVKNILVGRCTNIGDCSLIVFGDNIAIGSNVEFVVDGVDGHKVFIGSNVLVAYGSYLRSSNHRFDNPDKFIREQGHTSKEIIYNGGQYSIVIEDDTWIGANVTILSGAMIGEGSVIGAGSIVTGIIPPYSIAAGCPARVIAKRK